MVDKDHHYSGNCDNGFLVTTTFEVCKDDISDKIDQVGKSVHHGVDVVGEIVKDGVEAVKDGASEVSTAVNEFWSN